MSPEVKLEKLTRLVGLCINLVCISLLEFFRINEIGSVFDNLVMMSHEHATGIVWLCAIGGVVVAWLLRAMTGYVAMTVVFLITGLIIFATKKI